MSRWDDDRKRDEDRYYDLVYEAWRSGHNPDAVSRDDYGYRRSQGYAPDEIGIYDVGCKRRREPEPEPCEQEPYQMEDPR